MNFSVSSTNINIHAYKAQSIPVVSAVAVSPVIGIASAVQFFAGAGGSLIGLIKDGGKSDFYCKSVELMRLGGKNLLYNIINTLSLGIFGLYMKKQFQRLENNSFNIETLHDNNISKTAIWFSGIQDHVTTPSEIRDFERSSNEAWAIDSDDDLL